MSNYTKLTNFTVKDSLPSGNTAKIIKGTEIDNEFSAIAAAVSTKADAESGMLNNGTLAGVTAVTGTLNISATTTVTGALSATTFSSANATITGGFVDNTPIGSVTPSTGSFTTLSGNGANLTNLNAANIATGIIGNARTTATFNATANTIVLRGALGGFSANLVNVTGLTSTGTVNTPAVNGATTLALQTGGVDRVTLTTGGNLLVGTASDGGFRGSFITPSAVGTTVNALELSDRISTSLNFTLQENIARIIAGSADSLVLGADNTEAARITSGGNLLVGGTTDTGTRARFESTNKQLGLTYTGIATYNLTTDVSGNLTIDKDGAERARITSGGYFKASNTGVYKFLANASHEFNNNSGGATLFAADTLSNSQGTNIFSDRVSSQGRHFAGDLNGTTVYQVLANGNVQNTNNSYGAISDIKLKENITDATPKLDSLNKLRVVNYNLKADESKLKQIGLIAQEVEAIFPGLVETTPDINLETKEPNGEVTKAVKYSVLVPMLLKGMQEQQAMIQVLTDRIAALESLNKPQE